jgi:zinc transporter 1/2/3
MSLIKGTMSAISAGMLIYAGTVEMIAGDFVFGDVDGGHGHGHGHGHLPDPDPNPNQSGGGSHSGSHLNNDDSKQNATMMKKALAVLSLFAGVAGMVIFS